mmetsp:Transcript_17286/g.28767  ORF Transcript_17286/g.28767 Transcript_17286/m.28767 type:complete len:202 (-) Transcript_17286:54-659(-)|eukprot:CAMPEP_0197719424 /NCGR_PEP_ID=MMETSP1434-20131217/3186_1 /TAXON_ID=265543 /ORGANISM="Minutocellus polymorphus, Strain CCMP3303" /LENGTH=201 /DNA_ID=CAMNT_0043304173 /DNA_START=224 /DNA_END=832 /DNA_ORIENTATION=+
MANFGELVLVLGDLHIPHRASAIPEKFKRMLVPNKMQHVIATGNLGSKENFDGLRDLAPHVHVVAGDMEFAGPQSAAFPETTVCTVGEFRIGVIHGHQITPWGDHMALGAMRRRLGCDILISGHTHKNEVVEQEGFYHINPGSITGSFSATNPGATPSFVLLAVQGSKVVCYVYELVNGEVDVSKTEFTKTSAEDGGVLLR